MFIQFYGVFILIWQLQIVCPHCPNSAWKHFNASCFIYKNTNMKSWQQSQKHCRNYNSELASIHSKKENDFVFNLVNSNRSGAIWIGFNKLYSNEFKWSDETPVTFINWKQGEPNNDSFGEKCVSFDQPDVWSDMNCGFEALSVCRKDAKDPPLPVLNSPPIRCGHDWVKGDHACYKLYWKPEDLRNWSDALTFCRDRGGNYDLASVNDSAEKDFLITLVKNYKIRIWIGKPIYRELMDLWTDNSDGTYKIWASKQPSNFSENMDHTNPTFCTMMPSYGNNIGKWYSRECKDEQAFICKGSEEPLLEPTTDGISNSVILFVAISVLVLVMLIASFFVYKRCKRSKNSRVVLEPRNDFMYNDTSNVEEIEYETIDEIHDKDLNKIVDLEVSNMTYIGAGNFSIVYTGNCKVTTKRETTEKVVVKILKDFVNWNNQTDKKEKFLNELEIHYRLPYHVNVLQCFGQTVLNGVPGLVLEYAGNGTLKNLLQIWYKQEIINTIVNKITFIDNLYLKCIKFSREISAGMRHIANQKIVHRDLAARNILIGSGDVCKISDFGLARHVSSLSSEYTMTSSDPIPVRWLAPESLFYKQYSQKSDVWSFGILLWEIIALGSTPYPDIKNGLGVKEALQSGHRMPPPKHCSSELYDIMTACWKENVMDRPTFDMLEEMFSRFLIDAKEYVYFKDFDTEIYENVNPDIYREDTNV